MADKTAQLVLDALSRAVAEPSGLPLVAGKSTPGLFPATTAARSIAERCRAEGYLRVVRTETRGKTPLEICTVTDKGLAHLLSQVSPRHVLEDLVRAVEAQHSQVAELLATARQWHHGLEGLRHTVERVLPTFGTALAPPNGIATCDGTILHCLAQWHAAGDLPLPDLYRQAQPLCPDLTIGRFHDCLRKLCEQGQIYLHPWTGPLYDLPEPSYALLTGHEIGYYASLRQN